MNRKALSPVISSLILSATVIVVGGTIWGYANGASTVIAENYVNDTLELVNEVTERFIVEHVSYDSGTDELSVWVYNYGDQKIIVDTYATITTSSTSFMDTESGTVLQKGESVEVIISVSGTVASGDKASIKIHSRRQNNAYKIYYFP
jgi:hypothetical protein